MSDVNINIRSADQKRNAEVTLSGSQTGADVIQAAVENWSLPGGTDYSLVNTRTATLIQPAASLESQGVKDGDVLEVQSEADMASSRNASITWTDKTQSAPAKPAVSRETVTCPNCKADLRLPAGRSALVSCPFCNKSISFAA